ncbi:riboflavin biosynthesis protein RibD C-terminal domain protein [Leptospira inadai serovar Lyme str. 10]|uniref:Riboflavin biosynthesis protein RibD C-terminal domain protein n=2 Tax=Leptospira inadai serovar Lyme TaxID=293084 RepID=V6H9G4_9LEPT|nr:dihydrofolate reductase family protein [Leptospira inadai]EQA35786.1 riboflavin biosynthesis protein RibD C-terminal domain protein [Leptospira inadai serovar Lyme str. 10]PNV76858.1 pyrimidine reductase [Leptospira inadai serovar Lyme]
MRRIIVSEFLTLDGVMEDPGGAEKSKYGGWSHRFFNEEFGNYKFDELFSCDALLLGRLTYQGFAAAWPSMTDERGFSERMNGIPKFVVSTTLTNADWNNSTLIKENVVASVRKLKEQPGKDILVTGSGVLARTLLQNDLIDELRLMIHPILVGGGRKLFDEAPRRALELVESRKLETGVGILTYRPVKN